VGVNLAGGTHHAHADRGEGFCCFNDVAVAARLMQAENRARRVAIVDLDVHQGNGTATILAMDSTIFTLSIHGQRNWPFAKARSDLDVGLPDGTRDDAYLSELTNALRALEARFAPDLLLFIAGADVLAGDRLGRLSLTPAGIEARDRMVFEWAQVRSLPVAVAMAVVTALRLKGRFLCIRQPLQSRRNFSDPRSLPHERRAVSTWSLICG
jgi:acetoin utilization deacetylase AcuC-like enzyme